MPPPTTPRPAGHHRAAISVILIVRNGARFIAQALESIRQSTLRPDEILVIDGNSSDDTADIARRFAGVTLRQQRSSGIPSAYNEGIRHARGRYLAFISHDDLWLPEKLALQFAHLESHPESDVALCQVEHFLEDGMACPPGFRPELLAAARPGWIMEAMMARAEVFSRIGLFDSALAVSEDSDWFARALDGGVKISVLPETLVRKRVYDGNITLSSAQTNPNLLKVLRSSIQRKRIESHHG